MTQPLERDAIYRRRRFPREVIYAESFRGADHLRRILRAAQAKVDVALAALEHSDR